MPIVDPLPVSNLGIDLIAERSFNPDANINLNDADVRIIADRVASGSQIAYSDLTGNGYAAMHTGNLQYDTFSSSPVTQGLFKFIGSGTGEEGKMIFGTSQTAICIPEANTPYLECKVSNLAGDTVGFSGITQGVWQQCNSSNSWTATLTASGGAFKVGLFDITLRRVLTQREEVTFTVSMEVSNGSGGGGGGGDPF